MFLRNVLTSNFQFLPNNFHQQHYSASNPLIHDRNRNVIFFRATLSRINFPIRKKISLHKFIIRFIRPFPIQSSIHNPLNLFVETVFQRTINGGDVGKNRLTDSLSGNREYSTVSDVLKDF